MSMLRVFFGVSVLLLSACASDKVSLKEDPNAATKSQTSDTAPTKDGSIDKGHEGAVVGGGDVSGNSLPTDASAGHIDISKNSIYFDFDRFDVRPEYREIVQNFSKWAQVNSTGKLIVQGNTDERGGREYNLALGQKRAEAVTRSLKLSGVSESRLEAISFGKEKPKALGSDEAAWRENRRADIVIQQ